LQFNLAEFRICNHSILAAVISAGAIKHFRQYHEDQLESMQFELCKVNLKAVDFKKN
jgi:hypothetical protein